LSFTLFCNTKKKRKVRRLNRLTTPTISK